MTHRHPSSLRTLVALSALTLGSVAYAAPQDAPAPPTGTSAGDGAAKVATIGQPAPAFTLKDATGKTHKLTDYAGRIVVLQWINPDCPVCRRVTDSGRVAAMRSELKQLDANVVHLTVNSTHYMDAKQSREYLDSHKLQIPALIDQDGTVGHAYAAKTTPHMYVIDAKGILRYSGAIDDDARGAKDAPTNYVVNAVRMMKAGETVAPDTTRPYGCSVKFAAKGGEGEGGAARGERRRGGDGAARGEGRRGRVNPEMLKKYDTDGDGELSQAEREAMRADMIKEFDTDGDGELSREERRAMREKLGGARGGNRGGDGAEGRRGRRGGGNRGNGNGNGNGNGGGNGDG